MRQRIRVAVHPRSLAASRRVVTWTSGTLVGVGMAAVRLAMHGSVPAAVAQGVVCALIFAALMGPRTHDADAKQRAAIGPLAAERREEARRAATNGPVPADPEVRAAAARLTALHLAGSKGDRGWTAFLALVTVLSAWWALTHSPWWWLTAAGIAVAIGHTLWLPGHLGRRLARLQARDCAPPVTAVEPARSPAGVS